MSKVSAKQNRINDAKKRAPNVPGDTCPSINYVQNILEQISEQSKDDWTGKQVDVVNGVLEYVRESNEELRLSSYYWYRKYKAAA